MWSCGLPAGDVPRSKDSRLNSSAICCLRTCCGDVVRRQCRWRACDRLGRKSEVRNADGWTIWKLSSQGVTAAGWIVRAWSDRDSSSLFPASVVR
jgi:hypothetical protein